MHAPRRFTNEIWAKNNISSWSYHFNVVPANFAWTVGSGHASELAFVFGDVEGVGYSPSPFANKSDTYKQLARLMTRQWSSFVVNLDPNDSGGMFMYLLPGALSRCCDEAGMADIDMMNSS